MSTNNIYKSDLLPLHNVIQSSMVSFPKEIVISTLRDFFSKDSYYHYVMDEFGFAKTPDHTDLDLGQGLKNSEDPKNSTRLFIGENFRFASIYYPAILVKSNGSRYVPISINRDQDSIRYEDILYDDGYGNELLIKTPSVFITAGAWEGSISIDIHTRSLKARDELVDLVAMCFTEIYFDSLVDVGVIVKPINIGASTETDDRNDKLFRQTLTLDIRTEWRREIPIKDFIDKILFSVEFGDIKKDPFIAAPNLTINTEITIEELLGKF